mmetsp:Transcript_37811/g.88021  ORF Transcript_37811/g.88021 Transcript_37811/m.88021 type:complete len:329 (-) Transcript_37811:40-1026(-)
MFFFHSVYDIQHPSHRELHRKDELLLHPLLKRLGQIGVRHSRIERHGPGALPLQLMRQHPCAHVERCLGHPIGVPPQTRAVAVGEGSDARGHVDHRRRGGPSGQQFFPLACLQKRRQLPNHHHGPYNVHRHVFFQKRPVQRGHVPLRSGVPVPQNPRDVEEPVYPLPSGAQFVRQPLHLRLLRHVQGEDRRASVRRLRDASQLLRARRIAAARDDVSGGARQKGADVLQTDAAASANDDEDGVRVGVASGAGGGGGRGGEVHGVVDGGAVVGVGRRRDEGRETTGRRARKRKTTGGKGVVLELARDRATKRIHGGVATRLDSGVLRYC